MVRGGVLASGYDPGAVTPDLLTLPHRFARKGWRFWLCRHCYAPKVMHPRPAWIRRRPPGDNTYLSPDAPHFQEAMW